MAIDYYGNNKPHIHFTTLGKYTIGTKVRHKDKFNDPQEKEWYKKEYFIAKYNQFGVVYLTSLEGYPLWNHNGGIGVDNLIKVEDVMGFDMNQCKKGDKLVCRDGVVAEYVGKDSHTTYPHNVMVKDPKWDWSMWVTVTGKRFIGGKGECDIIGFYKEEIVVNKQEMIERNKEYDLKVTGEQLAYIFAVSGSTASGNKASSKLYDKIRALSPTQFKDAMETGTSYMNLHECQLYKNYLDNLFKAPETEKEKNLRELKEKHEELGKAIQKLEQSN